MTPFTSPCLSRSTSSLKRAVALLGLILGLALTVAPASAQTTHTVTNENDSGPGSLRYLITNASSGDTIDFNLPANSTIKLVSTLTVDRSITIDGSAVPGLAISGDDAVRVFTVNAGTTVNFTNLIIEEGRATNQGGGINNAGTLTLTNTTVSNNTITIGNGTGGGIHNIGTLTLNDSTVSGNRSTSGSGAGIYNASGTLELNNSTVSGNIAAAYGGGIVSNGTVTLNDSTVSDNSASAGGGIHKSTDAGTLTLNNSTVSGNTASSGVAGGIYHYRGTLTLNNSTVSGNTAAANGGGIYKDSYATLELYLNNSTVSGNTANNGAGIYNQSLGALTLINTTLAGNVGVALYNASTTLTNVQLTNTIVQSCAGNPVTDNGGNLDGGSNCGFTHADSLSDATLDLGALADNGGPTLTMLPGANSDALARGLPATCAASPINGLDQRGVTRSTTACTSGAVEINYTALTVNVTGNGSVSTVPPLISDCTTNCSAPYPADSSVTLIATPAAGYVFSGWSGACTGASPTTTVTMSAALSCTAQFAQQTISATSIPTLDRWALLLLALLAVVVAFRRLQLERPF